MNKIAAIWGRVSGPEQQSLPSQVAEVKTWLESQGWTVPSERILTVDWTSTDILRCPEMLTLLRWVEQKEVGAVGALHLDRFAARPGQIAQILDTFRQAGVELLLKQTPLPSGLMGELVGLVLTVGKALQVDRAGAGATKGLHDRPKLRRVPVTFRKPYGYTWEQNPVRLVPDENWDVAHFICREGLRGTPTRAIVRELKRRGVPSPTGKADWCIQTIWGIFRNPLYGGCFHALRREAAEPTRRMGNTYGKSSERWVPFENWVYLPEVEVVDPPLTWGEWLALQRRLEQNKLLAKRNAKRDYLLRGLIICDIHKRRLKGWPYHKSWRYVCPVGQECRRWLDGPGTEERAKAVVRMLIDDPDVLIRSRSSSEAELALQKELGSLEAKRQRALNSLVELERRYIDDKVDKTKKIDDEVYARLKRRYGTQCQWAAERTQEIRCQLANLRHEAEAVATLEHIRDQLASRLSAFDNADWRWLFTELGMTIHVEEGGSVVCHFALPYRQVVERGVDIVSSRASGARWSPCPGQSLCPPPSKPRPPICGSPDGREA